MAAAMMLAVVPLAADRQHVVFDDKVDFGSLRTFAMLQGRATTTRPEINNQLVLKTAEFAIRSHFLSKGLQEVPTSPDVVVSFSLGQDRPNGPSVVFDEGVIVVAVTKRDSDTLIWHGTYRDEASSPAKLAELLPAHLKKLLARYPPKKK